MIIANGYLREYMIGKTQINRFSFQYNIQKLPLKNNLKYFKANKKMATF